MSSSMMSSTSTPQANMDGVKHTTTIAYVPIIRHIERLCAKRTAAEPICSDVLAEEDITHIE